MKLFQYIIISSPSGAGKTTLSQMLLKDRRLGMYSFSVSHTTRTPREGEVHGRDYYFTDHETFRKMVRAGEFAEHARVHGNDYGTSIAEIRRRRNRGGDGIIFDIDYQGASQIKQKLPEALSVFILPPSIHELHRRLTKRGTENAKSLETRFRNSVREIRHFDIFDYVITNDDLTSTYASLVTVIKAHRLSGLFAKQTVRDLIEEWKRGKWKK
jgi:guanylate kinase